MSDAQWSQMTNCEKRKALFKLYAANLNALFPGVTDTFVCPFCQKSFGLDSVTGDNPAVILAHCMPKRLKGKLVTLACADCDKRAGTELDVHLKNRLETEDFYRGDTEGPHRVWIDVAGHKVRADFEITKGADGNPTHSVIMNQEHSNPDAVRAVLEALHSGEAFKSVPTVYVGDRLDPDIAMSRLAVLRSAFLMMFRAFGYRYVFDDNLIRLRAQLLNPRDQILPTVTAISLDETTDCLDAVGIVTEPEEMRSFFVPMLFLTESKRKIKKAVLLPGLGPDGDAIFERAQEHQTKNTRLDFRATVFKLDPRRLQDPKYARAVAQIWNRYNPKHNC